jgi:NAD+ kinase
MKVLLIVNSGKSASQKLASEIKEILSARGDEAAFFSYTDKPLGEKTFDLAFSLGGDGTVLFSARTVAARGIPIIPLHLGTLGFISSIHPSKWQDVFARFLAGKAEISERLMLDVRVCRGEKTVFALPCLNDTVISASGIAKTIRLEAWDGDMHLGSYRSDGLIAATPTGSTAYSSSAGGPILDPELEAVILNPICPFTLLYRPLVLPANRPLTVKIGKEQRSGILLTIDGQVTEALEPGDLVYLYKTPYKARLVSSNRADFYGALHTKLAMMGSGDA